MHFDDTQEIQKVDRNNYHHFTGRQRIEAAMSTLHGIVAGMVSDGRVNEQELAALIGWVGSHTQYVKQHPFNEILPIIHDVVRDHIIDEEEAANLLWLCDQYSSKATYYDDITQHIQQLHGFLGGIIADGVITEEELTQLSKWIDDHGMLRCCWPYDEIESLVSQVLKDGKIDGPEHEALMQFFGEFTFTPGRKAVGALDREGTISGVCAFAPEIAFQERFFCFTGSSKRSTRDGLADTIRELGGDFHKNLRNDTHYLVIGAAGNPCWAYACYGRKVEDAVGRRRNGQRLLIVHENDFWDAAADNGIR